MLGKMIRRCLVVESLDGEGSRRSLALAPRLLVSQRSLSTWRYHEVRMMDIVGGLLMSQDSQGVATVSRFDAGET